MKTRFAPSPTGWLHFGNVRTALFNFLFAMKEQGTFLLRVEDTDKERIKPEYLEDLYTDLKWLDMNWGEGPYLQSTRAETYAKYYQELIDRGHAYPCFCTDEELSIARKVQLANQQPPRYLGTCRNLSKEEVNKKFQAGIPATLRFKVPNDSFIEFVDLAKGLQKFAANDISDFIIRRNDGSASFMFCNAIDDALMGVTHALRGDDHLTNTPRQIMILNALNLPHPEYGHFAMINGLDGTPLSKRNGSESVRDLRAKGYLPLAVINYLARLGHYYANNEFMSIEQLAQEFSLQHLSTSPAKHDIAHLRHWQKEAIMRCTTEEIVTMIAPYTEQIPEAKRTDFANLARDNILMPGDVKIWVDAVIADKLDFSQDSIECMQAAGVAFFDAAIAILSKQPDISFKELADGVKAQTGLKGKELFMPLRIALTGQTHGPELARLLEFMSTDLILKRFTNVRSNYL